MGDEIRIDWSAVQRVATSFEDQAARIVLPGVSVPQQRGDSATIDTFARTIQHLVDLVGRYRELAVADAAGIKEAAQTYYEADRAAAAHIDATSVGN